MTNYERLISGGPKMLAELLMINAVEVARSLASEFDTNADITEEEYTKIEGEYLDYLLAEYDGD